MAFSRVPRRVLGVVTPVLILLASLIAQQRPAAAIPNTAFVPHDHSPEAITFPTALDPFGLALASGLPDRVPHQHRQAISFGGNRVVGGVENRDLGRPGLYDAYAVWDDRTRLVDDLGPFGVGHGYVDDLGYGFPTTIAGFRLTSFSAVRYCFSMAPADIPPGAAIDREQFRQQVRESFAAYSQLEAPELRLVTGLRFVEVDCTSPHEAIVRWRNIDDLGLTSHDRDVTGRVTRVVVTFDDTPVAGPVGGTRGWSLAAPAAVPDGEYHFRSVALHEIGHVVGLDHDDNPAEVMYADQARGCTEHLPRPPGVDRRGPCYTSLLAQDVAGTLDLYSVPAPDFGDAPDPYPTDLTQRLILNRGARAPGIRQEWMGPAGASTTTRERTPNQTAGDAGDDGCTVRGGQLNRTPGAVNQIEVTVSFSGDGSRYAGANLLRTAVWVDFNDDKDWTAGERVGLETLDPANPNAGNWVRVGRTNSFRRTFDVTVPNTAAVTTWMRCRLAYASATTHLSSDEGDESLLPAAETPPYRLAGTGEDSGGEIEDFVVTIAGEDCENGIDDDQDGAIDVQDEDCNDADEDDWPDPIDNCPDDADLDRSDLDDDGVGDVCDGDDDDDGTDDPDDNCLLAANTDQDDSDDDGVGDACDDDDDDDGTDDDDEVDAGSDPDDAGSGPESDDISGVCSDGLDNDDDGLTDTEDDGCPDQDGDGTPDVDDDDDDGDGIPDVEEPDVAAPGLPDPDDQSDIEHVLVGDSCTDELDNDDDGYVDGDDAGCIDLDGDGIPDIIDDDDDGDGVPDDDDEDDDGDGIPDDLDVVIISIPIPDAVLTRREFLADRLR